MRLTRAEWEDLCRRVYERDLKQAWLRSGQYVSFARWLVTGNACVASFLDPSAGPCSGRITFDHVKDQPKVGDPIVKRHTQDRKAPDDEQHLQSVCEHHHGLDVVGGAGWATTAAARERSRAYLRSLYPTAAADPGEDLGGHGPGSSLVRPPHDDPGRDLEGRPPDRDER